MLKLGRRFTCALAAAAAFAAPAYAQTTLKVALHKGKGTPLPDEWATDDDLELK